MNRKMSGGDCKTEWHWSLHGDMPSMTVASPPLAMQTLQCCKGFQQCRHPFLQRIISGMTWMSAAIVGAGEADEKGFRVQLPFVAEFRSLLSDFSSPRLSCRQFASTFVWQREVAAEGECMSACTVNHTEAERTVDSGRPEAKAF